MSKQEIRILNYIVICISEFAKQKNITRKEAYNYLKKYKGLEFLNECYEAEHTSAYVYEMLKDELQYT